jgi:hypothetical protein
VSNFGTFALFSICHMLSHVNTTYIGYLHVNELTVGEQHRAGQWFVSYEPLKCTGIISRASDEHELD